MAHADIKKDCTTYELTTTGHQKLIVHLSGSPTASCVEEFSRFMKEKGVTDVFCFCDPVYDPSKFNADNIRFHKLSFPDGTAPTNEVVDAFNDEFDSILDSLSAKNTSDRSSNKTADSKDVTPVVINVHCQSGLGRAPTIVAYLMISRCGIDRTTAIERVRKLRKGSLNHTQLDWLLYGKFKKIKKQQSGCIIA
ncbi:hypothetical protein YASMINEVIRUS_1223 [Yasminevirus sp. GU-2018]|uniref:Tyrosine specific protein phosphatases domain-containing protein n=1 Tax=Yasminevirus sp. GU-2018 TaxID=2420051 RepID=A0A5K0UAX0_9VIRU|nr:hypothetical protein YASMINEVIRUS_1223 [Yasminevirus sp. GU-2018]